MNHKYRCNPMNIEYKYQFFKVNPEQDDLCEIHREAADPSLVCFKGKYYLFPSVSGGFYFSEDLADWEFHKFNNKMPIYDYAPDVRVIGEYMYFSASKADENCSFYRTTDPIDGNFEELPGTFPFWDPNLFLDDDRRLYFYWGCSNTEPVYGVELDPSTFKPVGEKKVIMEADTDHIGFERVGEDHVPKKTEAEIEAMFEAVIANISEEQVVDEALKRRIRGWVGNDPYVEGAWMTKYNGKYYFQFATPGTEYNIYADGVGVGKSPLGPFKFAKNNPFSYKPGGFICGAGHGSTLQDKEGNWWHTSTMRISSNHNFERRVGLWKAGFDSDGELFCDQRYGDWPYAMDSKPWDKPDFMLLSYGKKVTASSGENTSAVTDENIRTFWQAKTNSLDESLDIDLGKEYDIRAIQVNFSDNWKRYPEEGMEFSFNLQNYRSISGGQYTTSFVLEAAGENGAHEIIWDTREDNTDLAHNFQVWEDGIQYRYIRISNMSLPYQQNPCISGIRVFGRGEGKLPQQSENVEINLLADEPMEAIDMEVCFVCDDCMGANILWGYSENKLYHSYMIFGKTMQVIRALVKNQPVFVRVDTFNENGITEGKTIKVR
ncbi:MAG: family 43 glycosylhydrolase [Lachnospiraceae bacterium]|nr:family 43 glycosylhydrolase [Lachnospiraceae bacterium]